MSEERIEQREAYSRRVVVYESERTAEQLERTAIARGSSFVRKVFLVVLTGLIIKLTYDVVVQQVK